MPIITYEQPGRRGTTEEMEDYVLESNNLTLLTSVVPCMINHPDYIQVMRDNWNFDINGKGHYWLHKECLIVIYRQGLTLIFFAR